MGQLFEENAVMETERAQEDKIREVEQRSRFIMDVAPLIIQYWNNDFVCVDCNQTTLDFYGFSSKEEYFVKLKDALPDYQEDGTPSWDKWNGFLASVFETGRDHIDFLETGLSGDPAYFEVDGLRTVHNGETVVITYSTDKTQFREKDRFQIMLDSSPNVITVFDKEGNVIDVNQAAVEFYGFASKQDYKKNFLKTTPAFQPDGVASVPFMLNLFREVIESGETRVYHKWIHQTVTGEPRPIEATLVPMKTDGKDCIIAHALDLREHFKLEDALEEARVANLAKSRFLAHMSHEIRTPLNAILGIAQIELSFDDLPERTVDALMKLSTSGNELLGIINDILDMSKIETGKMELNCIEYDTPSLISDAVNINIVHIGSKPVNFVLDIDSDLPSRLFGDELRIKQILNNLLSNAIKYTNEGQVKLSVSHTSEEGFEKNDVNLRLIVEDTGQGMQSEDVSRLFSEYSQFNKNANRNVEGTGLGLNITKRFVEMMNGTIEAQSEYGKGSIFTVNIKQKVFGCPAIGEKLAKQLCSFEFIGNRRVEKQQGIRYMMSYGHVLVVDDVEANLYVAKGLLAPYELHIETADSGFDAIDKVSCGKTYDVIFMDHMMPHMDGIETTKKLRDLGYKGTIVALTANALVGNAEMFMKNGFDGFISKPIDVRQLDSVLNKFVRNRHPESKDISSTAMYNPALIKAVLRDAEKAVKLLRETNHTDDLKLFIVTVHGMKSGLATIGEHDASAMAEKLEEAGQLGDTNFIAANTEFFIKTLEYLIETLVPSETSDTNAALVNEDTAYLEKYLKIIESACENYDAESAYTALDKLAEKPWKPQTLTFIEKIRNLLYSDSDFDEAAEMVKTRGIL